MSKFKTYITCDHCGHSHRDPFGARICNHPDINECCPDCGIPAKWKDVVQRWVDTSVWYRPSTWGTGHWEYPKG